MDKLSLEHKDAFVPQLASANDVSPVGFLLGDAYLLLYRSLRSRKEMSPGCRGLIDDGRLKREIGRAFSEGEFSCACRAKSPQLCSGSHGQCRPGRSLVGLTSHRELSCSILQAKVRCDMVGCGAGEYVGGGFYVNE